MSRRLALLALLGLVPAGCLGDSSRRRDEPAAVRVAEPARTDFAEFPRAPGTYIGRVPNPPAAPPESPPVPAPVAAPQSLSTAAFDSPLVAAMRAVQDGRGDGDDYLRHLSPPNRNLILRLLHTAAMAAKSDLNAPASAPIQELAAELSRAQAGLAPYAPLKFEQAVFVERAEGFARYTPVPRGHRYPPGSVAELYVELHNARPAPVGPDSAQFELKFRWKLKLIDKVTGAVRAETEDQYALPPTRSPVRDCYFPIPVTVPGRPGDYLVSLEMRDLNRPPNGVFVSRSASLRVGGRD